MDIKARVEKMGLVTLMAISFFIILFFNFADVQASFHNCEQIEELKAVQLAQAEERHKNLDRNGRLLKIEITPEVRATSLEELKQDRLDFAPKNCKRFYIPFTSND